MRGKDPSLVADGDSDMGGGYVMSQFGQACLAGGWWRKHKRLRVKTVL